MDEKKFLVKEEGNAKHLLTMIMKELHDNLIYRVEGENPFIQAKLESERWIYIGPTKDSRIMINLADLKGNLAENFLPLTGSKNGITFQYNSKAFMLSFDYDPDF